MENIAPKFVEVVDNPVEADFAIIRFSSPAEPGLGNQFEKLILQGQDLEIMREEKEKILTLLDL